MKAASQYEIALRYREKFDQSCPSSIERLAQTLRVSQRTLERYLLLAMLDPVFIAAIGGPSVVKPTHAEALKRAAKTTLRLQLMKQEARHLSAHQSELRRAGRPLLPPNQIVSQLVSHAAGPRKRTRSPQVCDLRSQRDVKIGSYQLRADQHPTTIRVFTNADASAAEIKKALSAVVDLHFSQIA